MGAIERLTQIFEKARDKETEAVGTISIAHKKSHEGKSFYVIYSVASLGAMTTPDDMITIDFTTPEKILEEPHFTFSVKGTAEWRVRLIEAPTGGAASPTGTLEILNHNRYSGKTSEVMAGTTPGYVNYDSTLATGGKTLWDEYLEGSAGPQVGGTSGGARNELELKPATKYQLSLYGTDTNPATIMIDWYDGRK